MTQIVENNKLTDGIGITSLNGDNVAGSPDGDSDILSETHTTEQVELAPKLFYQDPYPLDAIRSIIAKRTFEMKDFFPINNVLRTGVWLPDPSADDAVHSFTVFGAEPREEIIANMPHLTREKVYQRLRKFAVTGDPGDLSLGAISIGLDIPTLANIDEKSKTVAIVFDSLTDPEKTAQTIRDIQAIGNEAKVGQSRYLHVATHNDRFTVLVLTGEKFFTSSAYVNQRKIKFSPFQYTRPLRQTEQGAIQAGYQELPMKNDLFLPRFFSYTAGVGRAVDAVADSLLEGKIITPGYILDLARKLQIHLLDDILQRSDGIVYASGTIQAHAQDIELVGKLAADNVDSATTQGLVGHFIRNIGGMSPVLQRVGIQSEIDFMGRLFQAIWKDRNWQIFIPQSSAAEYATFIPTFIQLLLYYIADHARFNYDAKDFSLTLQRKGQDINVYLTFAPTTKGAIQSADRLPLHEVYPAELHPLFSALQLGARAEDGIYVLSITLPSVN